MKVGEHFAIIGAVIRDVPEYRLTDSKTLERLIVSQTELHPNMSTRGHTHDAEEVYIFTKGKGIIQLGSDGAHSHRIDVEAGSVVTIRSGEFHKVYASGDGLDFLSIFERYEGRGK